MCPPICSQLWEAPHMPVEGLGLIGFRVQGLGSRV